MSTADIVPVRFPDFGCPRCIALPEGNERRFAAPRFIYDSSHEHWAVVNCEDCGQRYLEQFLESIDWSGGGHDVMWTRWVPLSSKEAARLDPSSALFEQPGDAELELVMRGRIPRLCWPSDGEWFWSEQRFDAMDLLTPG